MPNVISAVVVEHIRPSGPRFGCAGAERIKNLVYCVANEDLIRVNVNQMTFSISSDEASPEVGCARVSTTSVAHRNGAGRGTLRGLARYNPLDMWVPGDMSKVGRHAVHRQWMRVVCHVGLHHWAGDRATAEDLGPDKRFHEDQPRRSGIHWSCGFEGRLHCCSRT